MEILTGLSGWNLNMNKRTNLNITPQSLEANHPLEKLFSSIHRCGCFSMVSQSASIQDQWLFHAWVTERKPNSWVISRFTFTPRFPLSSRCHVMKCIWSGKLDKETRCSERVKQMINLSAQSEDSGWNSHLFFTLVLTLNKRVLRIHI